MSGIFEEHFQSSSFDQKYLREFLFDSKRNVSDFEDFQSKIHTNAVLQHKPEDHDLPRSEKIKIRYERMLEYFSSLNLKTKRVHSMLEVFNSHIQYFIPALEKFCNEEQLKKLLPLAKSFSIYGTFALNEVGNGRLVSSLGTEAIFQGEKREFVLNTPNYESTKWWVLDGYVAATHAIVIAKVKYQQKSFAAPFLVQLKNLSTRKSLPGIQIGECGPKFGANTIDHAFLSFENVVLPFDSLLGTIEQWQNEENFNRLFIGVDAKPKISLLKMANEFLAKSNAIAVRYSLQRKQFQDSDNNEMTIFNYLIQRGKIIPHISEAFSNFFLAKEIDEKTKNLQDIDGLTYSLVSSAKAMICQETFQAMEEERKACGGHGFSMFSGIPELLHNLGALSLIEGNPFELLTLAAVQIVKSFQNSYFNHFSMEFLKIQQKSKVIDIQTQEGILLAFQKTARFLIEKFVKSFSKSGKPFNLNNISLKEISKIHFLAFSVFNFSNYIKKISEPSVVNTMNILFNLYAFTKIKENLKYFFEAEAIISADISLINSGIVFCLDSLHKEAFALTEVFGYHEKNLNSALVFSDGQVYQRLFDWASNHNPINANGRGRELALSLRQGMKTPAPAI